MSYQPTTERLEELPGYAPKIQKIYDFPNGYGASVIKGPFSFGGPEGFWELAVFKDGGLCYDTPITDDVIGWLTWEQVEETLAQIAALPTPIKSIEE